MTALALRLVHSSEWSTWRRHKLNREIRNCIACTRATLSVHGIADTRTADARIDEAALVFGDHWEHITRRYPSDWVEVATEAGWL